MTLTALALVAGVVVAAAYLLRIGLGGNRADRFEAGAVSQTWITEQRIRDEQYP